MSDMLPGFEEIPETPHPEPVKLTRGERNALKLAAGVHPATGYPLAHNGRTCGDCAHLWLKNPPAAGGPWWKCGKAGTRRNDGTDMTKSWPACALFEEAHSAPVRFQLSRAAGWRMPKGGISVARPHKYGNPFIVATPTNGGNITREQAVVEYEKALLEGRLAVTVADVRRDLAGHDLGCFCPLPAPGQRDICHATVLLRIANP